MAMFPFSSVISLGIAFRKPLEEEEEEELRRPDLSLPLPLDMAGSDFTVIPEPLLSLLALVAALNREGGPSLVIVTLPCLALPSLYHKAIWNMAMPPFRRIIGTSLETCNGGAGVTLV